MFSTEQALVERLMQHFNNCLAFKEIGVGYGISDILIVRNKTDFYKFLDNRQGKYLKYSDEVKAFDYIRKRNGVSLSNLSLNSYISKSKLKYNIINHLISINAIYDINDNYYRNPNFTLFNPLTTAIEAKLTDWNKGLAQAIRYQRFANKTYLAIDEKYVHRVDKEQFIKYNVGLMSVGDKVKELIKPIQKPPSDSIMRYKISEELISKSNAISEMHY